MILLAPADTIPKKPKPIMVPWEVREDQIVYTRDGRRLFDAEAINRAIHIVQLHNAALGV